LPAEDRELIRLQHDQRLTPSQISRRLAIPPASLKSRSRLAHRRLAGIIGQLRAEGHVKVPSAAENMSERRGRKETGSQRGVSGPNIVP
jgi:hypothetical protein